MKVRMLTVSAGPEGVHQVGDEVTVGDEHGRELIDGRFAVNITRKTRKKRKKKKGRS